MAAEVTGFTADENLRFENVLRDTDHLGDTPDRWIIVAKAVGNGRTPTEVRDHYFRLRAEIDHINITALHARAMRARA